MAAKALIAAVLFFFFGYDHIQAKGSGVDDGGLLQKENFIVLYSTLGYELNSTKRALVRTLDHVDPNIVDIKKSEWWLLNSEGKKACSGAIRWAGVTYGVQLWEIDFSDLKENGFYQIYADIQSSQGKEGFSLSTQPFEISERLHYKRTFRNISIINAEARMASDSWGYGYFDCNSKMGEAYSHGIFLAGLAHAYERRQDVLDTQDRGRLAKAVNVAADYLFDLHIDSTGEIVHEHESRPNQEANTGPYNTQEGLYGLATYAHLFKDSDPARAEEAFRRSVKSVEYLKKNIMLSSWLALPFTRK